MGFTRKRLSGGHVRSLFFRLVVELRVFMRRVPLLYRIGARMAGAQFAFVDQNCHICIEAPPRCANSFAVSLVNQVNSNLRVAHHTHAVANVKESVRLGIPTFVVVREPLGFLVSYILRRNAVRGTGLRTNALLGFREYESFYRFVYRIKEEVNLLDFASLISHPGSFLGLIRTRCPDLIPPAEPSRIDDFVRAARDGIRAHERKQGHGEMASAVPSETRKQRGEQIRQAIVSEFADELAAARRLYEMLTPSPNHTLP